MKADTVVTWMAKQIEDGDVVATGVASPLAILAIALARATHAPRLHYLACVGSLDPRVEELHGSSEDLRYLDGRNAEITIPDLFDHARRGRIHTVFFGAAEVDGDGATNMSASGSLGAPRTKFPGVAGASSLRRWVRRPILVVPRQSRRALVEKVQIASTADARSTKLVTDLGVFEVGGSGAMLTGRHTWATETDIEERTGFAYRAADALTVTQEPDAATLAALHALDPKNLRQSLVG